MQPMLRVSKGTDPATWEPLTGSLNLPTGRPPRVLAPTAAAAVRRTRRGGDGRERRAMALLAVTDPSTWQPADRLPGVIPHLAFGVVTAAVMTALPRRPRAADSDALPAEKAGQVLTSVAAGLP